jgi:hypothetical protein
VIEAVVLLIIDSIRFEDEAEAGHEFLGGDVVELRAEVLF